MNDIRVMFNCPYCSCHFLTRSDLENHKNSHWKKTKNGDGEIMDVLDPMLKARLQNGSIRIGNYIYCLLGNGSIIYRREEIIRE